MKIYDDQLIVVTGGAGFIGSGLIRHLNDRGLSNILVVDDLGHSEKWKNLIGKKFVEIVPKDDLFQWLEGRESIIEAFVHLGACTDSNETNGDLLLKNNYRYSIRLAEYALKHGHRFLYASSVATYGSGAHGFSDQLKNIYQLEPQQLHGFSKQLFDQWVFDEGVLDKVVGLKYFKVFGPNEAHKKHMASPIPQMVAQIQNEGPIHLHKSSLEAKTSEEKWDFIYVKDAVRMTTAFLENEASGIFNIGSGRASSWNDLAGAVSKAMKRGVEIEYMDIPHLASSYYPSFVQADMSKTKDVLKQDANCLPLEEAVNDYVNNYLIPDKRW